MRKSIILLLLTALIASCSTTQKVEGVQQTIKQVVVSSDSVFEDQMEIPFDDKGVQLTVRISFDEIANKMLLSLSANRKLFVFRTETKYKDVFTRPWFITARKLHPEKLKYPVLIEPNTTYRLPKEVYNTFAKPGNHHVFNKWLENVSKYLTPMTTTATSINSADLALVYDSLVQRFDVDPRASQVSFTLRNILFADAKYEEPAVPLAQPSKKKQRYNLVCDKDLKLTYKVILKRNPCYETEELLDSLKEEVKKAEKAYHALQKACPTGTAASKEEAGIFKQHQDYLLSKFQKTIQFHDCPEVQAAMNKYNQYIDSIGSVKCKFTPEKVEEEKPAPGIGCRPEMLLAAAHSVDNLVARIMASHDPMEIRDLKQSAREVIRTMNNAITERGIVNDEQRKALAAFRRAESYFKQSVGY